MCVCVCVCVCNIQNIDAKAISSRFTKCAKQVAADAAELLPLAQTAQGHAAVYVLCSLGKEAPEVFAGG